MVSVDIMTPTTVPGFGMPLTMPDMERGRDVYNSLPHVDTRFGKKVDRDSLKGLLEIIRSHNLGHMLAVHNLHRHDWLPAGTVRLEKDIGNVLPGAKLTPPVQFAGLDLTNLRPLIYQVEGNNLVPYEFGEGRSSAPVDAITAAFVTEFTNLIGEKGLADVFALEIGDFTIVPRQRFTEIEIDDVGTLVVPTDNIASSGRLTETSWDVRGYNPENSDNDGTTTHLKVIDGTTHEVFTHSLDKSPRSVIGDLIDQGVIKKQA